MNRTKVENHTFDSLLIPGDKTAVEVSDKFSIVIPLLLLATSTKWKETTP
jgi:hypothetical protein